MAIKSHTSHNGVTWELNVEYFLKDGSPAIILAIIPTQYAALIGIIYDNDLHEWRPADWDINGCNAITGHSLIKRKVVTVKFFVDDQGNVYSSLPQASPYTDEKAVSTQEIDIYNSTI